MVQTLEQIDGVFAERPGFRLVDKIKFVESGVDPMGLRQVNLDLMENHKTLFSLEVKQLQYSMIESWRLCVTQS